MSTSDSIAPIPTFDQADVDALAARLAATRLPEANPVAAAMPGPAADLAPRLLEAWRDRFDVRSLEERAAELGAFTTTTADGRRLAALHVRADKATGLPILLIHGWPDTPIRFVELIPLLTAAGHDVVAPAIPGFWHSDEPTGEMSRELAADDFHALMTRLGYERYAVHGGDWGSAVAQSIALHHPDSVAAVHLTDVPFDLAYTIDKEAAGDAESAYLEAVERFSGEALYLSANTTQPNLIATVLQDSPIGLAAWLGALYEAWSETPIADEHIIANAALLSLTGTVRSSLRLYSEPASSWDEASWNDESTTAWTEAEGSDWGEPAVDPSSDANDQPSHNTTDADDARGSVDTSGWSGSWAPEAVTAPTAFALFPKDIAMAPRQLAERFFAVERFTIMSRGGHFAALEEPQLLADDLLDFLAERT
ncbi:MAG: alpha/beta fold hydrolase [Microthrixaceae bacterium]